MPFDIVADAPVGDVGELDELEQLAPLLAAARRAGQLLVQGEQLVGRAPVGEAEQLGEVAERGLRRRRAGRVAADRAPLPPVGRTSPQTIFTSVDLPAPLGPSRPISSPGADLEVDAAQRLHRSVGLAQAAVTVRAGAIRA